LLFLFHEHHPVSFCTGQSYSTGSDRYTDPYGIWRDLQCLCSVAIINTNVGHKVWELWLCFSNMRNASLHTNQLKHTHIQNTFLSFIPHVTISEQITLFVPRPHPKTVSCITNA
jgi:hypothetical protein